MLEEKFYNLLKQKTVEDMDGYIGRNPDYSSERSVLLEKDVFEDGMDVYLNLHLPDFPMPHYHGHDFFELNYVFRGSGMQYISSEGGREAIGSSGDRAGGVIHSHTGDKTAGLNVQPGAPRARLATQLREGQLCILSPDVFHRIEAQEGSVILNLSMSRELFNSSFLGMVGQQGCLGRFFLNYFLSKRDSGDYLLFQLADPQRAEFLLSAICDDYLYQKPFYALNIRCLITLLFSEIIRGNALVSGGESAQEDEETAGLMQEMLQYLSENFATVTLTSAAEHFHYHPNYLSSLISRQTGQSFSEILTEIKAARMRYYLEQTNIAVDDIAELLGYSSVSSFYQAAKKVLGETPVQYRRNSRSRSNCLGQNAQDCGII